VYDGDRPWVVVGQSSSGAPIAVPLNDARGKSKWWAPTLEANELLFAGSKNSKVELNHLWSFDDCSSVVGDVATSGRQKLSAAIESYFE
jgi:hypothetical protein